MAAQYTEVTLDDMERFLKRGYRALRPQQGVQKGEYYYDLALSPGVVIRVWTSVQRGSSSGAGVGEDAIRVQFYGSALKRPLVPGKAPIVKRTQNWRNTLQSKIEDYIELYEEKASYWDAHSGGGGGTAQPEVPDSPTPSATPPVRPPSAAPTGGGPPPTDKQVNFVKVLMSRGNVDRLEEAGLFSEFRELEWPFNADNIRRMTSRRVSQLIDRLIPLVGYQRRYAADDPAEYDLV
jgi:hypothetical protein